MTPERLRALVQALPAETLGAIRADQCLLLVDDERLVSGACAAFDVIFRGLDDSDGDADTLRAALAADVDRAYQDFYRTHPLTQAGFDRQVRALLDIHGRAAFAAPGGGQPQRSLFVDGGEVLANDASDPRFRYGAWLELNSPADPQRVEGLVDDWLQRGLAYQRYLSMNVCRYNC